MQPPAKHLPCDSTFDGCEGYTQALLDFVSNSQQLRTLCGGVHILDFLTRESDLYQDVLPAEWRSWLSETPIADILDFLMRQDLSFLRLAGNEIEGDAKTETGPSFDGSHESHLSHAPLPASLVGYVQKIRSLSLDRSFTLRRDLGPRLPKTVTSGMSRKKLHEVERFASYVDELASHVSEAHASPITHLVDFGSGQNYLGRVLASPPCRRRVVGVERRPVNIDGARRKDINAKLAQKEVLWRNKKAWRETGVDNGEDLRSARAEAPSAVNGKSTAHTSSSYKVDVLVEGRMQYVQQSLGDGNLEHLVGTLQPWSEETQEEQTSLTATNGRPPENNCNSAGPEDDESRSSQPRLLVMSLHSCGNLLHHGLRSLVLNPAVRAVAMLGCCYNLCTERLGPPTYKLPSLRTPNRRLEETSSTADPHGFPMSKRFMEYEHVGSTGIRFNITARMMAVQAPQNWTQTEYESFFTRHFYRALLQRLFLDRGFVRSPERIAEESVATAAGSGGEPVIIGSLRKACYVSFVSYVRGALEKLAKDPEHTSRVVTYLSALSDAEIAAYEERYRHRKHHLCILWSLMAFSAGVVEAAIVVDRWCYLKEQPEVQNAWVETVFEYEKSPRNLVVVGIKR